MESSLNALILLPCGPSLSPQRGRGGRDLQRSTNRLRAVERTLLVITASLTSNLSRPFWLTLPAGFPHWHYCRRRKPSQAVNFAARGTFCFDKHKGVMVSVRFRRTWRVFANYFSIPDRALACDGDPEFLVCPALDSYNFAIALKLNRPHELVIGYLHNKAHATVIRDHERRFEQQSTDANIVAHSV